MRKNPKANEEGRKKIYLRKKNNLVGLPISGKKSDEIEKLEHWTNVCACSWINVFVSLSMNWVFFRN